MEKEDFGNIQVDGNTTGTVKHWKGTYGFITPDDPKLNDVFIHCSEIEPWRKGFKELKVGQKVKFGYVKTVKGYDAKNLEVEREDVPASKFKMNQNNGR